MGREAGTWTWNQSPWKWGFGQPGSFPVLGLWSSGLGHRHKTEFWLAGEAEAEGFEVGWA